METMINKINKIDSSVLITFIYRYLPVHAINGIALLPCILELSVLISDEYTCMMQNNAKILGNVLCCFYRSSVITKSAGLLIKQQNLIMTDKIFYSFIYQLSKNSRHRLDWHHE